jgi:hypothetical protein
VVAPADFPYKRYQHHQKVRRTQGPSNTSLVQRVAAHGVLKIEGHRTSRHDEKVLAAGQHLDLPQTAPGDPLCDGGN